MRRVLPWLVLGLSAITMPGLAQSRRTTAVPAAREAFAKADAVKDTNPESAAALYRQAIDADPGFFPAHEAFILSMKKWKMGPEPPPAPPKPDAPKNSKGIPIYFAPKTRAMPVGGGPASADLKAAYDAWIGKTPDIAVLHWGLGVSALNTDKPAAEAALKKAIALDPKFSPAYRSLALLAQLNRDNAGRVAYLKQAVDADPLDDDALIEYVDTIPEGDRTAKLWTIADRSPGTPAAYAALLRLSNVAPSPVEKLPVYERFWKTFPALTSYSHCWTMKTYFSLTSGPDPDTALAVAKHFDDACVGDPDWPDLATYQLKFNQAQALMAKKDPAPALALLESIAPPKSTDGVPYHVARARAEGTVNPKAAYERLLPIAARQPKDALNEALTSLATTLGKTTAQMDDDVWAAVGAQAKPFADFTLKRFDTGQPLTLSSLKGQVVLVNFWFPTCGPCMNEFPYIEQTYRKYKDQGFTILAINIVSAEDGDVLKTLRDKGVSFTALQMPDKDFASRTYKVAQAPVNFLIDRQGRFLFQPQIHDRETARTFELEVEMLLKRR